jgi:hypothetical protein
MMEDEQGDDNSKDGLMQGGRERELGDRWGRVTEGEKDEAREERRERVEGLAGSVKFAKRR